MPEMFLFFLISCTHLWSNNLLFLKFMFTQSTHFVGYNTHPLNYIECCVSLFAKNGCGLKSGHGQQKISTN